MGDSFVELYSNHYIIMEGDNNISIGKWKHEVSHYGVNASPPNFVKDKNGNKLIKCEGCNGFGFMIDGTKYPGHQVQCKECQGDGYREMTWTENILHGRT